MNLVLHHLRFTVTAQTTIRLGMQAGAQLRGALWEALRQFACAAPSVQSDPNHALHCPLCHLMALEMGTSARGVNPPRPFAINPPLVSLTEMGAIFRTGESFSWEICLFGEATDWYSYIIQAVNLMGKRGVGHGRGLFTLQAIEVVNLPLAQTRHVLQGRQVVVASDLITTPPHILQRVEQLPTDQITLRFLTPTQLVYNQGKVALTPHFETLIPRLLERCQSLETFYADQITPQADWLSLFLTLSDKSKSVYLVKNTTHWVKAESGSSRTLTRNSVGGLVGEATYKGDLTPFREWLVWGELLHVGKNAVKGNGWYQIVLD
jgi:hypothetical protein